ncbi:MAG TPA: methylated-DNA--[protein]-cysteine S-methyltransferase [Pirellulales bacterium]|jgi:methylated-DNA-[protein]-cysteine S-methyltransferase|nr:methylated-DNA--[protein]-cysteine S-methyltransferase [Pirellulales bacterium]
MRRDRLQETTYFSEFCCPLGTLLLVSDGDALSGLYFEEHKPSPRRDGNWRRDDGPFEAVREQLSAYFAGDLVEFDLRLVLAGTEFQRSVWRALRGIDFGQRESYAHLANRLRRPSAVRAVGAAIARNPISIVVPCHRVIGSNGALTGYAGGLERKQWLLEHEAQAASRRVGRGACDSQSRRGALLTGAQQVLLGSP